MSFLPRLLGWLLVALILGLGAYAAWRLDGPETQGGGGILDAIPRDLPAIQAQIESIEEFGAPLLTRVLVVATYEGEMAAPDQINMVGAIVGVIERFSEQETGFVAGLPLPEALSPESTDDAATVVITYLYFDANTSVSEQLAGAARFRDALLSETGASFAGVTGALKASDEQAEIVDAHVHWIEGATLALVFAIVGLRFRSLIAPVLVLLIGGLAYVASMTLLAALQEPLDLSLPSEVRPLLVVLIFGVVADYSIFYLGSFRSAFGDPETSGSGAAWQSWQAVSPIVTVAAAVVAIGGLALYVADINLIRSMAPAIAMAIGLSYVMSLSVTPLMFASFGSFVFWPDNPRVERHGTRLRGWSERQLTRRAVALPVLVVLGAGLVLAAFLAQDARMATTLIRDLPDDNEAARAEQMAAGAFPEGTVAPTVLIIYGTTAGEAQSRLQDLIEGSPGVAAVLGPQIDPGIFDPSFLRSESGNAVRYLIVFDSDPYGAHAIEDYQTLADNVPSYLTEAGMTNVEARFAGDTAVSSQVSAMTFDDLLRVGAVLIALELLLLLLYLRSLVAPPLLVGVSLLLVLGSLGLTAVLSGPLLGHESLTFLVPIATMVLLLSLGADYNLFLVGQVWAAQKKLPFTDALQYTATETSSTILTAGLALTASFAILAVVPLASFRQIALAMSIGLLVDTLIVRPILVPAMLASLRRLATWPAPRLEPAESDRERPALE